MVPPHYFSLLASSRSFSIFSSLFPFSFLPSFLPSFLFPSLLCTYFFPPNLLQLLLCVSHRLASKVLGQGIPLNLYYRLSYEERTCHGRTRSSWIIQSDRAICFADSVGHCFLCICGGRAHGVRLFARYCAKSSGKHAESPGSRGVAFSRSKKVACVR